MISSWTTNGKATTVASLLVFENNVGKDGLSSQSTYKGNIYCPNLKASIAPNPKVKSTEWLENIKGTVGKSLSGNNGRSEWIAVANRE
jgi:hypothetical protein